MQVLFDELVARDEWLHRLTLRDCRRRPAPHAAAGRLPRRQHGRAAYLLITLVMTWPLVAGLASDVPGDLGDSLLNMWILGWGAEHLPRVLTGQMTWGEFWNANIFHPEPLALSLSEHLFGQVLQILPVYYLTGNLILCYNLLFLSSFALSGLGAYLLVRDLIGDHEWHPTGRVNGFSYAAFIAVSSTRSRRFGSLRSRTSSRSALSGCHWRYMGFDDLRSVRVRVQPGRGSHPSPADRSRC